MLETATFRVPCTSLEDARQYPLVHTVLFLRRAHMRSHMLAFLPHVVEGLVAWDELLEWFAMLIELILARSMEGKKTLLEARALFGAPFGPFLCERIFVMRIV